MAIDAPIEIVPIKGSLPPVAVILYATTVKKMKLMKNLQPQ
jgi:hypothetical protein